VILASTSDSCVYLLAFSRKHQSLDDQHDEVSTVFLTVAEIIRHLASTRGADRSSVAREETRRSTAQSAASRSSERNQREGEMLFRETQRRRRRLVSSDFISMPRSLAKWNSNLIEGTRERTALRERSNLRGSVSRNHRRTSVMIQGAVGGRRS